MPFRFRACTPVPWKGRYTPIIVKESAYHVPPRGFGRWGIVAEWNDPPHRALCWAKEERDLPHLTEAVVGVKERLTGHGGGGFRINEFGQVIVPIANSPIRYLVGEVEGRMTLENPFKTPPFLNLWDDHDLQPGSLWRRPNIGIEYHLSRWNEVYFWRVGDTSEFKEVPPCQDEDLIGYIRAVRPWGGVRIRVNEYGIILTKAPPKSSGDPWQPVYVGRINPGKWFRKETS